MYRWPLTISVIFNTTFSIFNTTDYVTFLDQLYGLGVGGMILWWFSFLWSYLVLVRRAEPAVNPCFAGFLGALCSPFPFNIDMMLLDEVIHKYKIKYYHILMIYISIKDYWTFIGDEYSRLWLNPAVGFRFVLGLSALHVNPRNYIYPTH